MTKKLTVIYPNPNISIFQNLTGTVKDSLAKPI